MLSRAEGLLKVPSGSNGASGELRVRRINRLRNLFGAARAKVSQLGGLPAITTGPVSGTKAESHSGLEGALSIQPDRRWTTLTRFCCCAAPCEGWRVTPPYARRGRRRRKNVIPPDNHAAGTSNSSPAQMRPKSSRDKHSAMKLNSVRLHPALTIAVA